MAEKLCALRKKGGGQKYTETSLWTNPSPTSTFAAQSVSLSESMDNFKYLKIRYKDGTTGSDELSVIISVTDIKDSVFNKGSAHSQLALDMQNSSNVLRTRAVGYVSSTSIQFSACYNSNATGSDNTNVIPLEILGLNELDHGKGFDETTLWTNSAPTTAYTGGTVSLSEDIDNFDFLKITYRFNVSVSTENEIYIPVSLFKLSVQSTSTNHNICTLGLQDSSNNFYVRNVFYASDTSVTFTTCYKENGSGNTGNGAIPLTIVGCKFK